MVECHTRCATVPAIYQARAWASKLSHLDLLLGSGNLCSVSLSTQALLRQLPQLPQLWPSAPHLVELLHHGNGRLQGFRAPGALLCHAASGAQAEAAFNAGCQGSGTDEPLERTAAKPPKPSACAAEGAKAEGAKASSQARRPCARLGALGGVRRGFGADGCYQDSRA